MSEDAIFAQVAEGSDTPEAGREINGAVACQFAFPGHHAMVDTTHSRYDKDGNEQVITRERIIEIFTDMGRHVALGWSIKQAQV